MAGLLVGHYLVVRDQHNHLDTEVLEPDPVCQGAEVVPKMQRTRGPISGQDPKLCWCRPDSLFQDDAAVERGLLRRGVVGHR